MIFRLLVTCMAFAAVAGSTASADERADCSSFSQPKCSILLSTGITMRYVEVGPSNGPVVFLLHGFTDTGRAWERVLPILQRLLPRHDIIVPDLRGHGSTSMPAGADCPAAPEACFEWGQFAADIIAFMDARHIPRAAVVGHSMGTLVAQELGLSSPRRIDGLVLVSTAAAGQEPAVGFVLNQIVEGLWQSAFLALGYSWPDGAYDLSPGVAVPGFRDFIDNQWVLSAVAPSTFLDELRSAAAEVPLGTWIGALKNIYAADNTERLRHLRVPTLALYGIQDDIFSRADEATLIDSLRAAASRGGSFWWKQYGELPPGDSGVQTDLGHNLPQEAPAGVATDIASFLERGRPTRTLYHTDFPEDVQRVVAEPGRALIISDEE